MPIPKNFWHRAGRAVRAMTTRRKQANERAVIPYHPKKKYSTVAQARTVRRRGVARPPPFQFLGGAGASSLRFSHGKALKINPTFQKKVREAVCSENYYNLKSVGLYICNSSQCNYFGSPTLYSYLEAYSIAHNINSTASVIYTMKYLVKSVTMSVMLVNASNAQAYVRVYECTPRNDIPATGVLPMTLLANGFLDTQSGSSDGYTDIDQTAFASSAFCQGYKIGKVRLVKFNPGEQKTFVICDNKPCLINMARWNNQGTQMIYGLRNRSRFLLFQYWGQVATDSANTAHVGTTIATFRAVYTMKYSYQFAFDYTTNVYQGTCTDASGNSAVMTTLTTPQIIEEVTGAIATVVQD